ncbi:MAG: CpsD/CapB family tyrosine-protein kinase [Bacillota bacterium]
MKSKVGKKNLSNFALLYNLDAKSPIVEAYRNLRTNLNYISPDYELKTIAFSSVEPGDGKSLSITNLAISMANNGQKVILIDSDMRRPKIHRMLNLTSFDGLSNILSGEITLEDALKSNEVKNLSVITSGTIPPNPSELISSEKMSQLLKEAGQLADVVLVDSPPVAISDAAILGNKVDGFLMVVNSHNTKERQIVEAIERLEKSNTNIIGSILNFHPYKKYDYYGEYYTY